ncbi:winged helix-turn-helix transcriptional regulator [Ligilactobacillus murinus]|uniref:winged helix-turn-helix transcriptional regulator n=1 Tax=Ligilactobacillus murinus TaxID=1622 RepID=UPI003B20FCF6
MGLINSFIQKTKLRIWTVDFAESIEGIDENEKQVLKALSKIDGSLSKKELQAETGLSRHYATKSLEKLITADYVLEEGAGRSIRYRLNRTLEQKVATIKQRAADLRITKEIN